MKELDLYEMNPVDYIRYLFSKTRDGRLIFYFEPEVSADPYMYVLMMDWTEEDVQTLIERYSNLEAQLRKFVLEYETLKDEKPRIYALTSEERTLWEIYMEPCEGQHAVDSYRNMSEFNYDEWRHELSDENLLKLRELHEIYEADCLNRLPVNRTSPADMIRAANRFATFFKMRAPSIVMNRAACNLAEQMAIYYHAAKDSKIYSVIDRIANGLPV